jgi:hypothetical protein
MKIRRQIIDRQFAVAAAFTICASTTQAQYLVNSGFENPLVPNAGVDQGWAAFGTAARSDMLASLDYPHGGDYALLAQNAPGNNWNPVGVQQVVSGVMPGEVYYFSCWYMTDTGVIFATPVALELGFLDSAMVNIGITGGFNYSIPSNDTWYQGSVTATAPAGSAYAVVYAMFMDNAQQSFENVYFDDAFPTPEPSSLALASVGLTLVYCSIRCRNA